MSIGVIFGEMPDYCAQCELCKWEDFRNRWECVTGGIARMPKVIDYDSNERPDWCPLQEVKPVKHGWWQEITVSDVPYIECSECEYYEPYTLARHPYCPNCGAKMRSRK